MECSTSLIQVDGFQPVPSSRSIRLGWKTAKYKKIRDKLHGVLAVRWQSSTPDAEMPNEIRGLRLISLELDSRDDSIERTNTFITMELHTITLRIPCLQWLSGNLFINGRSLETPPQIEEELLVYYIRCGVRQTPPRDSFERLDQSVPGRTIDYLSDTAPATVLMGPPSQGGPSS